MNGVLGVIPLRMASTRLPGKPLLVLGNLPVFAWVYQAATKSAKLDKLVVATESASIQEKAEQLNIPCLLTPSMNTGSDRVCWVSRKFPGYQIVVNIQGDEPFLKAEDIDLVVTALQDDSRADVATLYNRSTDLSDYQDPSKVKLVADRYSHALYFSRSPLPHYSEQLTPAIKKHCGIYAYRREFLIRFNQHPQTELEKAEQLEQLRILEMGGVIAVRETSSDSWGIDTQQDYDKAKSIFKKRENYG